MCCFAASNGYLQPLQVRMGKMSLKAILAPIWSPALELNQFKLICPWSQAKEAVMTIRALNTCSKSRYLFKECQSRGCESLLGCEKFLFFKLLPSASWYLHQGNKLYFSTENPRCSGTDFHVSLKCVCLPRSRTLDDKVCDAPARRRCFRKEVRIQK